MFSKTGQSNSVEGRVLVPLAANPDSVPGTPHGSLRLPGAISEHRARASPEHCWVSGPQMKTN